MSHKRIISILLILVVLFEVNFFCLMKEIAISSPGFEIFDMKLFYSVKSFNENLDLLQNESYQALITFKLLDMIFPAIYGLLLFTWLRRVQVTRQLFLSIPLIGMSCDYLENIVLTIKTFFINNYDFLIYFTNIFTLVKFTCIVISVCVIIYYGKKGSKKNDNFRDQSSNN